MINKSSTKMNRCSHKYIPKHNPSKMAALYHKACSFPIVFIALVKTDPYIPIQKIIFNGLEIAIANPDRKDFKGCSFHLMKYIELV